MLIRQLYDIIECYPTISKCFKGVIPSFALHHVKPLSNEGQTIKCYIVLANINWTLHDSSSNTVGHYLVVIAHVSYFEIFDPMGCNYIYDTHLMNFKSNNECLLNNTQFQSEGTSTCGLYCLLYIMLRCSGLARPLTLLTLVGMTDSSASQLWQFFFFSTRALNMA